MDKRCRNETTLWLKFELISLYVANDRAYYLYNSIEWIFYNHWWKNDIRQSNLKEIGTNTVEGFMNVAVDILVDQRDISFDDAKSVITQSIITLL